jgi:hypothetical protein
MKITNTIEEAKAGIKNIATNGVHAFVVLIPYSARKAQYGINYLNPSSTIGSTYTAADGRSIATIIEKL